MNTHAVSLGLVYNSGTPQTSSLRFVNLILTSKIGEHSLPKTKNSVQNPACSLTQNPGDCTVVNEADFLGREARADLVDVVVVDGSVENSVQIVEKRHNLEWCAESGNGREANNVAEVDRHFVVPLWVHRLTRQQALRY